MSLDLLTRRNVAIGIASALLILVLWFVPQYQSSSYRNSVPEEKRKTLSASETILFERNVADIENSSRVTIAQILGGVVLLSGLYFTFQGMVTARKNLRIAEEGHLTDRFSKSIGMLSSESLETRLGGIYALERIAKDSLKDHWTVMEVLTAFIRERSPWPLEVRPKIKSAQFVQGAADIQAAITVVGRRRWLQAEDEPLNLMGVNLEGCNLRYANLDRADLTAASLVNTFLGFASLNKATLIGVDLSEAYLLGTNLNAADLTDANLNVQTFFAVNMYGAVIPDVFPQDVVGDLKIKRLCLNPDQRTDSRRGLTELKNWQQRFRRRTEKSIDRTEDQVKLESDSSDRPQLVEK